MNKQLKQSREYNKGILDGLLLAVDLIEKQRELEVSLGGIDEANGIYQAKRQVLKYLENFLVEQKNLGYDDLTKPNKE